MPFPDQERPDSLILTLLGPSVPEVFLAGVSSRLLGAQIFVRQVRSLARGEVEAVELLLAPDCLARAISLLAGFRETASPLGIDVFIQAKRPSPRSKRLIVLDMDSTLTQIEVIDELAKEAHVGRRIVAITARAMNGELSFPEALRERVGLLKGLPVSALEAVYRRMPFTPGAEKLLRILQKLGCKTAVLSGGFDYFAQRVQKSLGLDYADSNGLEVKDGALTGKLLGRIVDGERKRALMEEIAQKENIPLSHVIAVGDGANDLPMIMRAGLGIAFNAKPAVRAVAQHHLCQKSLAPILYLLGLTDKEIDALD